MDIDETRMDASIASRAASPQVYSREQILCIGIMENNDMREENSKELYTIFLSNKILWKSDKHHQVSEGKTPRMNICRKLIVEYLSLGASNKLKKGQKFSDFQILYNYKDIINNSAISSSDIQAAERQKKNLQSRLYDLRDQVIKLMGLPGTPTHEEVRESKAKALKTKEEAEKGTYCIICNPRNLSNIKYSMIQTSLKNSAAIWGWETSGQRKMTITLWHLAPSALSSTHS